MTALLRDVEVAGQRVDVRVEGERITEIGPSITPTPDDDEVVDGHGGAVLPGLHDHHLHLLSFAASLSSVNCGPNAVGSGDELAKRLSSAPASAGGWVRGVAYHEEVAGPLDRHVLDTWVPDRPVRVQHRGGALWTLNSRALEIVGSVLDQGPDVERSPAGEPTGRLWRYDSRLRSILPDDPPDLTTIGRRLAAHGITSVTDATPDLDADTLDLLAAAVHSGAIPQRVTLLGAPDTGALPHGLARGPRKLLLRDHDLPSPDELAATVAATHAAGRPVAVHCVTAESLVLTLGALDHAGFLAGDRIEHAAVVPPGISGWIARSGLRVVTQPDFVRTRGDTYRREIRAEDLPYLYPYASLASAGVPVAPASDAPFGESDPWRVIATAADRRTRDGATLGTTERVPVTTALAGYLSPAEAPGGPPRRVVVGAPADLILLDRPLTEALAEPTQVRVRSTWVRGRRVPAE